LETLKGADETEGDRLMFLTLDELSRGGQTGGGLLGVEHVFESKKGFLGWWIVGMRSRKLVLMGLEY
jgi:hypothetical protein